MHVPSFRFALRSGGLFVAAFALSAVVALAQPALTAPVPSNLGAGQVTLTLQSSASGTGYFTLLEGATGAPGSGAQTKAALDANGAAAARFGSLPLGANAAGSYTVRNLKAGTAYTVCFTADDGATLQPTVKTAKFTTKASANLTGHDWISVGAGNFSDGDAFYPGMALAPDGTPYVSLLDQGFYGLASVKRFNGTTWDFVGERGLSNSESQYTDITFAPDGTLYVANSESNTSWGAVRRFNGSDWEVIGGAGFAGGWLDDLKVVVTGEGTIYVAFRAYTGLTAMKFGPSGWVTISAGEFSGAATSNFDMVLGPDGAPYIAYGDSTGNRPSLWRYNGSAWGLVGGKATVAGASSRPSLAFAPDGSPHVVFCDGANGGRLSVAKYDGAKWTTVGAPGFATDSGRFCPVLAVAPDGADYVAFHDAGLGGRTTVMRFTGASWEVIGRPGFSIGDAYPQRMIFSPDGVPLLLISDGGNEYGETLMKLAPATETSYAQWVRANFTAAERTKPEVFGAQADPDGGGVANLVRFGLGLPARGPVKTPPTTLGFEGYWDQYATLTFNRRCNAPGLTYTVQASDDLIRWFPHSVWGPHGSTVVKITDFVTVESQSRRFLRVKVASDKLGLKVLVPAYFYPVANSPWARLSAAAAKTPAGTINAIANVNNGPDSGQAADIAPYQQVISDLRAKGGRVFGYVSTAYGTRDLKLVQADVALWYSRYGVDGIFLDEQATTPEAFGYYRTLHDDIAYNRGGLVIGNPGTATTEAYMEVNEVTCVFETDGPTGFPTWTPPAWTANYPAGKFYVLPYNSSAANMSAFVARAAANNAGWIYVTNDTLPNPWDTLPSYFESLVTAAMLAE